MESPFKNLIKTIKDMMNSDMGIYEIRLLSKRSSMRDDNIRDELKLIPVRLSPDKTKILVDLYEEDTLEEMAEKILQAESMMDEALKFKRYKENSPYLVEALKFHIPELLHTRTFYGY